MERDAYMTKSGMAKEISTHTLTWSVTTMMSDCPESWIISTHTLTWSVTRLRRSNRQGKSISTHTLTWSVTAAMYTQGVEKIISTHTLTWSVTDKRILIDGGLCDFNSHAHVERDT